jgi:phosphoglycerate dehydrogenase-like enzyme
MKLLIDYPLSERAKALLDKHCIDYVITPFPHVQDFIQALTEMPAHLRESFDVLIGDALQITGEAIKLLPNLQWVHHFAAGLSGKNSVNWAEINAASIIITTSKIQSDSVSELALALILSLLKKLPECYRAQEKKSYGIQSNPAMLYDKSVLIIGTGNIGAEIGIKLAHGFGVTVYGINEDGQPAACFHEIGKINELDLYIRKSDIIILACPLTEETRHLIDQKRIEIMKPGTLLVNIARGELVDQQALIAALNAGVIAGAASDVFEDEPLTPENPIWDTPNLIVTPHIAGFSPYYSEDVVNIFLKNRTGYLQNATDKMPTYANRKRY